MSDIDELTLSEDAEAITFEDNENDIYDEAEKIKINNILHSDLTYRSNGLQCESVINSLISGYYIIPKFQRKFVWKKRQVANLALSIIKDVPIPPIYLFMNEKKKEVVLDGQQRVTALFLYFNDLWYVGSENYDRFDFKQISEINERLRNAENESKKIVCDSILPENERKIKSKECKDSIAKYSDELKQCGLKRTSFFVDDGDKKVEISFKKFTDEEKEFLLRKRMELTVVECRSDNAQKVYASIFKLLNSGGKLLSSQEIRNGVYWELELYDRLFELNRNENWRRIYGKESAYSKDIEILLKILSLNYYSTISDGEIEITYPRTFNWSNIMEDYSSMAAVWNSEQVSEQITLLTVFLNNLENVVDRENKTCNKAVFEAAFVAYSKLNCNKEISYDWLCEMGDEIEFQKGQVLSNKASVLDRLNKAYKLMREKYGE